MKQIFNREIADDPYLRVVLLATTDGKNIIDTISLPLTAVSIYAEEDSFVGFSLYMNKDLADTVYNFFNKYYDQKASNGEIIGVRFIVHFDNEETFYSLDYPFFVSVQQNAPRGGAILHSQVNAKRFYLCRNTIFCDPYTFTNIYNTANLSDDIINQAVTECLEIQKNNPPRPLSPLELMRRNAAKRFSNTAPVFQSPGAAPPTAIPQQGDGSDIFDPSTLKIQQGSTDPEKDLMNIVGLEDVKREFIKMKAALMVQKERAERHPLHSSAHSGHMCFMGAPGTGKTTIARVVAGVLYEAGMIQKNQCVEVSGLDLLANYLGQTATKTQAIINHAAGGVLFIDEAYAIVNSSYGKEAVGVLLKEMEDNRAGLVVILAGYEKDMNQLLQLNEGFRSRINRYFHFENYAVPELGKLLMFNLKRRNLLITGDALKACLKLFSREVNSPNFSNGRYVRNFTEQLEDNHIINRMDRDDTTNINLITIEDVPKEEM